MSALFSPIKLRGLTLSNRIMVAPMCQYSSVDGDANDWHFTHINSLALSGAGIFCIEATAVEANGRITPGCLGLYNDANEAALKPILASVRKRSKTAVMMQLAHAGRKASSHTPWDGGQLIPVSEGGWRPEAPSAHPAQGRRDAAAGVRRGGACARARGLRASPPSAPSGSASTPSRCTAPTAICCISSCRRSPTSAPINMAARWKTGCAFRWKCSTRCARRFRPTSRSACGFPSTDWVEGGWDLAQTIEFAKELKKRGVDWIDASSGGVSPLQKIPLGPGYQVPFAQAIKEATGVTTIAVGLITEARQAEEIVASGKADMVALARGMLYDPRWGWHAAAELGGEVEAPPQYWRSQPSTQKALFGATTFGTR